MLGAQDKVFLMPHADLIATVAAGISLLSLFVSGMSYKQSERNQVRELKNELNLREVELIALWSGMHLVSSTNPIATHVERADRALRVTARRWIDDAGMRHMIYELFAQDYVQQFEALRDCKVIVPGTERTGSSLVTDDMRDAYAQMKIYGD